MALVNVFIMGLHLFSDVGIGISIIQNKRGDEPDFLNTAWTLQVIRGIGVWCICLLLAYPVSNLYGEPQLQWVIPLVGINSVMDGFCSTALVTLGRHMAVKKLTILELTAQFIQITVMCIWAWLSPSLWALVAGSFTYSLVKLIWSHRLIAGQTNRFQWEKTAVREIFNFGRWVFLSTSLMFLAEQADRLLLGKLFSLELLGVYGIALTLSDLPRQVAIALSMRVLLPATSKLADLPRSEMRARILPHRQRLLLILTLGMVCLIGAGDLLILFLYDDRYAAAAWMLPLLALGIWPRLLCCSIDSTLTALGKVQYQTVGNFFRLLSTVAGIWIGFTLLGPLGAVIAVALNDVLYYATVNLGLCREGLNCLWQDLQATLLLLVGLMVFWEVRALLGIHFEFWEALKMALPTSP
jgi:O-antigen/teichoic acid export membrane protein